MTNNNHLAHIQFTDIVKKYGRKRHRKTILNNIDIELNGGECTLISGENGSGKSTLLRIMAGLLKPDSAFINTGLETLSWKKSRNVIRRQIMYLYQEPYMFDGTVFRNLSYAIKGQYSTYTINQALKWAGLEHHADTQAKCLSGGEKQRVALAQAWLKQPSILLLDEPTANMDKNSRHRTEELLCKFKESGTALFIASHDLNHFHQAMDKRLFLQDGIIIEVNDQNFRHINKLDEKIAIFPQRGI